MWTKQTSEIKSARGKKNSAREKDLRRKELIIKILKTVSSDRLSVLNAKIFKPLIFCLSSFPWLLAYALFLIEFFFLEDS